MFIGQGDGGVGSIFGVESRYLIQGCKSSYKSRNSYFFKIPPKISYFFLLFQKI